MKKNKYMKYVLFIIVLIISASTLNGCMRNTSDDSTGSQATLEANVIEKPDIPDDIEMNSEGIPLLTVYNVSKNTTEEMDLETYVMGVVAGEMKNDWPEEALKAQAILARTYVLKFIDTKDSIYDGADISTDVSEAQAYSSENINDAVKKAVNETQGEVMSWNGEYPYAWFHASAGGMTELPSIGLDYEDDPEYLKPVSSPDSDDAPDSVKQWSVTFSADQIEKACADNGVTTGPVESIELAEKGESGRAKYIVVNGKKISAPGFRIAIGASMLKSTLIDSIEMDGSSITFTGRGYGHGVGMSQWGAYQLAQDGSSAEDIIEHYFTGIDIVKLW